MAIGRAGNGKYHRWIKEDKGSILRRYIVGMGERDDLCIKKNWKIDRPLAYCRLEILSQHVLPGKMRKWKCFHRVNWSPAPLDYTTRLESRTRNNFARAKYGKERQKGKDRVYKHSLVEVCFRNSYDGLFSLLFQFRIINFNLCNIYIIIYMYIYV